MERHILLVDDDPDVVTYVSTVLENTGCRISTAANGEEALQKIDRCRPDLVMLDILMPRQSGMKMYRSLKTSEALKKIPVIILSGISRRTFLRSQEVLDEFEGAHVPEPDAYLEKPAEPEELIHSIEEALS